MIYIYGASGHGKVILDILTVQGVSGIEFVDDGNRDEFLSYPVKKPESIKFNEDDFWIIGVGDNKVREKLSNKFIVSFINAIHPSAIVSQHARLGKGIAVMPGAVINADVTIGNHVIANTNCSIDHDCIINDFVHISPGVTLCGSVFVGNGTLVGAGVTVIPGVTIGEKCVIGAGAVIVNDVPDYSVIVGIPGKIIKMNDCR